MEHKVRSAWRGWNARYFYILLQLPCAISFNRHEYGCLAERRLCHVHYSSCGSLYKTGLSGCGDFCFKTGCLHLRYPPCYWNLLYLPGYSRRRPTLFRREFKQKSHSVPRLCRYDRVQHYVSVRKFQKKVQAVYNR